MGGASYLAAFQRSVFPSERKPFDHKAYHDQALGFGTLAPKFVRRLMGL